LTKKVQIKLRDNHSRTKFDFYGFKRFI